MLFTLIEGVERVEKFVLGLDFARNKLNIIHQHQVRFPVFGTEVPRFAGADGINKIVNKFIAFDVQNPAVGTILPDYMGNCIQQVGFSKTGVPVNKQGIVVLAGGVGDGASGGTGQTVGRTDDEGIESKFVAVHHGLGFLFLLVLVAGQPGVVQKPDGHVGGKDIL